jgi:hypothetical protein
MSVATQVKRFLHRHWHNNSTYGVLYVRVDYLAPVDPSKDVDIDSG